MRSISRYLIPLVVMGMVVGCVPQKKYAELQKNYDKSESEREYLSGSLKDTETEKKELSARFDKLSKDYDQLSEDHKQLSREYEVLNDRYKQLEEFKAQLLENQEKSSAVNKRENQKLLEEMIQAQEDLQDKEDQLKLKASELADLEARLNATSAELEAKDEALKKREARINELEEIIAQKDAAVRALKDKVAAALLNFKDKGLTVTQKNGRIVVSMEAKLLFPSGSTQINPEGKQALVDLSKVLEDQNDITILVEGHTDIDPMSGAGCIKDNWDLSVMRSTAVVKLMLANSKIDPAILTAAGRSQFVPVDPATSAAAKAKNRRIEIILAPNLDQLFEILDEEAKKME